MEGHIEAIKKWLKANAKRRMCPFSKTNYVYTCEICESLFPEIKGTLKHPCHVLYIKDVIKIAREAVR